MLSKRWCCGSSGPGGDGNADGNNLAAGALTGRNANKRNRSIEAKAAADLELEKHVKKLLLLGAGESGKSTMFKQVVSIYGKGYTAKDRSSFTDVLRNNCLASMVCLVQNAQKLSIDHPECQINARNEPHAARLLSLPSDQRPMEPADVDAIAELWDDPAIKQTFEMRNKFQLYDAASYFFDRVRIMTQSSWVPSYEDVLRARVRTTGIVESEFTVDDASFRLFDVGGQRNERKKWLHAFENVTSVLFVAAISEYDQNLYEDAEVNRIDEALTLFDEVCNSRWFRQTSMILFLNKRDLFAEKLRTIPLSDYFPGYEGPNDYDPAVEYLRLMFLARNRSIDKEIYVHVTCATDTNNVAHVFNAVKDIVVRDTLREDGLL